MKLLVSGATGFIGQALVPALQTSGHSVVALTRGKAQKAGMQSVSWDPQAGVLDAASTAGFDAVIHLAGESIMGLWTKSKLRRVRESRVRGTELLTRTILSLREADRPRTFISASAIGYYGNRGAEVLTEESARGTGFLPELCADWEQASAPLSDANIRTVWMRLGIILDPAGATLKQMLPPFKLGLGAVLGSGQQWFSWMSRHDLVNAFLFVLEKPELVGPVNCTSPGAVRNREFTQQLARAVHRPAFLKIPAAALRLLSGNMADEALLASARVVPQKLQQAGMIFQDTQLATALRFYGPK